MRLIPSFRAPFAGIALALLLTGCGNEDPAGVPPADPSVPAGDNVALVWNRALLQAVRTTRPGPPQMARSQAIVHTAMYDAWAAYDAVAIGTRYPSELRRPGDEHTPGRKSMAISHAAYRALLDLYPTQQAVFAAQMRSLGYNPDDESTDRTTPVGIGNVAAAAALARCYVDGSNQRGDLAPGAYADYTGYQPVNPPLDPLVPTLVGDLATAIPNPARWQPLTFVNGAGQRVTPGFICPQWGHVTPFALTSPAQFRPGPPAAWGTAEFRAQCEALILMSAELNDETKSVAEYWADGPNSELPPGHWCLFAQWVSERDHHTLDQDVKLFFALTNAMFDASIAVWDAKAYYDYCRPVTAIRALYAGQRIVAWGGPGQGPRDIDGGEWRPFQPASFPTPPFAEYTSGHSAFSAAGAEILRRFTDSDAFGYSYTVLQGSSKVEPGLTPAQDLSFPLPTFTDGALAAALSRRYGGIHFEAADVRSRDMGRRCAVQAWEKATSLWDGRGPAALTASLN